MTRPGLGRRRPWHVCAARRHLALGAGSLTDPHQQSTLPARTADAGPRLIGRWPGVSSPRRQPTPAAAGASRPHDDAGRQHWWGQPLFPPVPPARGAPPTRQLPAQGGASGWPWLGSATHASGCGAVRWAAAPGMPRTRCAAARPQDGQPPALHAPRPSPSCKDLGRRLTLPPPAAPSFLAFPSPSIPAPSPGCLFAAPRGGAAPTMLQCMRAAPRTRLSP